MSDFITPEDIAGAAAEESRKRVGSLGDSTAPTVPVDTLARERS